MDVGSGSGALGQQLRSAGLSVLTCDYEPATPESVHFDLTGNVEDALALNRLMRERTSGAPWLVTCLDVLEHMDIEHVFNAVRNLRTLADCLALVSISTRPSSRDNRFHATVIPMVAWKEILSAAGLRVEDDRIFSEARTVRRSFGNDPDLALVKHWAQVDPFHDIELGEPSYLLLSKNGHELTEKARSYFEDILDIAYRRFKREQFGSEGIPGVALNIHHPQDFVLLRPLLDVLPGDKVTALVRSPALLEDERSVVRGFFARAGVPCIEFDRAEQVQWTEMGAQWLLSGAESNVAPSHILSRQLVEAAKLNGLATLQFQHGIWVESFRQRMAEFGSEIILGWGPQYQQVFADTEVELAGRRLPKNREAQFRNVGAARFVDSKLNPSKSILRWRLGIDIERYRSVVLLGTNLKWGEHKHCARGIREMLAVVMAKSPEIFFVVKLHPSERADQASELVLPNSLVLDDIVLAAMDLHISRLIAGSDIVVSSLSTLLLDAAVAGKPCIQYDTGNRYEYASVRATPIEQLNSLLDRTVNRPWVNNDFAKHYAAAASEPFYSHLHSILTDDAPVAPGNLRSSASFYSIAVTVEDQVEYSRAAAANALADRRKIAFLQESVEACHLRAEASEASTSQALEAADSTAQELRRVQASFDVLAANHQRAKDKLQHTLDELVREQRERAALLASRSWKLTSPLRAIRRLLPR